MKEMKTKVTVQDLSELQQVAKFNGRKINVAKFQFSFPTVVYAYTHTDNPETEHEAQEALNEEHINGVQRPTLEMSFEEFKDKYLV